MRTDDSVSLTDSGEGWSGGTFGPPYARVGVLKTKTEISEDESALSTGGCAVDLRFQLGLL